MMFLKLKLACLLSLVTVSCGQGLASESPQDCIAEIDSRDTKLVVDRIMSVSNQNELIASSEQEVDSLGFTVRQTQAVFIPDLSITSQGYMIESAYNYSYRDGQKLPATDYWSDSNELDLALQIEWTFLDIQSLYEIKEARANLESQRYTLAQSLQTNSLSSGSAFLYYIYSKKNLQNIQSMVGLYRKQLDDVNIAYQRGQVSKIDVLQAKQQLASYSSNVLTAESTVNTALLSLETYLGKRLCSPQTVDSELLDVNSEYIPVRANAAEEVASIAPSLQTLRQKILAIKANKSSYYASLLPTFSLIGSADIDTTRQFSPTTTKSIDNTYSVSIGVNWDLISLPDIYAGESASRLEKSQVMLLGYQTQELLNSFNGVAETLPKYYGSIVYAEKSLAAQKELLDLTLIGYRAGYKTSTDIQQASTDYLNALNALAEAEYQYQVNILTYESYLLFPSFQKTRASFKGFIN